ncbi:MAG: adhesin, partial [Bacteroidaceae bacterium]|nr:adhesin [Bacteroidaceae bacterium]
TIEKDEVIAINTRSMTEAVLSVAPQTTTAGGMACDLLLTFNGDKCTVSSATQGVTAQGEGLFVTKGEKKAWGDKDRDALYLKYSIDYGNVKVETTDTLVLQTRATNQKVTFSPKYIQ